MSDFDSSLPIRTQNNGDVAAKIVDGTTPSQALAVDASGRITTLMDDGAGNPITSQANGAQQALDVGINVAGVQIDPRLTEGAVTTAAPTYTTGTNQQLSLTTAGALRVDGSGSIQPVSGTVTADQGTSPWITQDLSDGSVAPGAVASYSSLAGGQYNSTPITLTDGQQAALQVDASGHLLTTTTSTDDHNYGTVGANTLRTAAQIGNATGAADFNFGAVGAQTLRTAAELGNATGLADYNNGATGAQTLRVAANLAIAGANVSITNPVPVTIEDSPGTHINDYKDASSIAAAATDNHDYTVTAAKTLHLNQVEASASGKAKMIISVETGVATGTFTPYFVQFNSTAETNMVIKLNNPITVAAGVRVRVSMTNRDLLSQDLYSTICGYEL